MPRAGAEPGMSGILFIISAPSGSGKSTLVNELRKFVPSLEFSVSYTTRPPRGSEQDGQEYHFIGREEFEGMIMRDQFLEHAEVFGNYYGTAKTVLQEAAQRGNDVLLDIDVQGERQVKLKMPDAVSVFVLPPSRKELESRLRKRSSREIVNYPNYDYILVNDHLEQSLDHLVGIVMGERVRRSGKRPSAEEERYLGKAEKCLMRKMEGEIKDILASFDESHSTVI